MTQHDTGDSQLHADQDRTQHKRMTAGLKWTV
jgi:hypothetical protein